MKTNVLAKSSNWLRRSRDILKRWLGTRGEATAEDTAECAVEGRAEGTAVGRAEGTAVGIVESYNRGYSSGYSSSGYNGIRSRKQQKFN